MQVGHPGTQAGSPCTVTQPSSPSPNGVQVVRCRPLHVLLPHPSPRALMLQPGGHLLLLARQELKDQCPSLPERDAIRWVITVPAIWKQPAKQFMREAAYKVDRIPRGGCSTRSPSQEAVLSGGYLLPPSPCGCCPHNEGSLACPGSLRNKSWTLAVGRGSALKPGGGGAGGFQSWVCSKGGDWGWGRVLGIAPPGMGGCPLGAWCHRWVPGTGRS